MFEERMTSKTLCVLFFIIVTKISCETSVTPELQTILEESYCNITCTANKDVNNCHNCSSSVQLNFRNDTEPLQVDWLCRDENVLSFNWTSNSMSIYVIEFKSNSEDWTFYEQTVQNFTALEDLEYDEEYQIRIWTVSPDGSVEGPFLSDTISTLNPNHDPLTLTKFKFLNWEYENATSFIANLEWEPAEDRLCFYSIWNNNGRDKIRHTTEDFTDVFKEKVPGFSGNRSYILGIAPIMHESVVKTDGKFIKVTAPNCMELYKSLDMCLPILPGALQLTETISKYMKIHSENLTYDVNVAWANPEYKPDNYTISIAILKRNYPLVTKIASGNSTSITFYNVTLTPHYSVVFTMSSKLGHDTKSFERMFTIHPNSSTLDETTSIVRMIAIYGVTGIFLAVISLISFFCYKRYEKSKMMNDQLDDNFTYLQPIHQRKFCIVEDEWKLNPKDIEVGEVIGEGVFGVVHQGRKNNENIAIKMLKGNYTSDEVRQFEKEIEIMKSVGFHKNIVSLIGFCVKPEYSCPLLIVEYCELGNLQTRLRSLWTAITKSQYNNRDYVNCSNGKQFANLEYEFLEIVDLSRNLLSYAHQVAAGMKHLSNNKVIHRDLATRNILMCANGLVKIADFGLSRDVYLDNTYIKTSSGILPVKWMAIESIRHQVFTSQSDVWSFGVLLWEIATFGEHPYSDISHEKLLKSLLYGYRLGCPKSCLPNTTVYEIMLKCWDQNPLARPTFTDLVQNLEDLLKSNNEYLFINPNDFNEKEVFL